MKILIVEDDFVSRTIMQRHLSELGECDLAIDGEEALKAFKQARKEKTPYDLICLDIMMPKKDGQQVLKEIREYENKRGILGFDGVKVIMTTALDDPENVFKAYKSQCESYLVKPIDEDKLFEEIKELGLLAK